MNFIILLILLIIIIECESYCVKVSKTRKHSLNDNDNKYNNEIIPITYTNNGKERRALRAISNRMKQSSTLLILPSSISYNENFIKNVIESLDSKEMVLLKFNDIGKKKDVKEIISDICKQTKSEIIQVLGHTALIYKEKGKASMIRKALNDELERTKEI